MKLLLTLVLLLLSYCLLIKGDNYIQYSYYSDLNSKCKGKQITKTQYYPNSNCLEIENQSIFCSSSKGTLVTTSWSDANCTGKPLFTSTTQLNTCSSNSGSNYIVNCVDDVQLPSSNAFITIASPTCDWKENFNLITINPTVCVLTAFGTYSTTCNETTVTSNSYQYGSNCGGVPYQSSTVTFTSGCVQGDNHATTNQCL